jgi:hypothetical protein
MHGGAVWMEESKTAFPSKTNQVTTHNQTAFKTHVSRLPQVFYMLEFSQTNDSLLNKAITVLPPFPPSTSQRFIHNNKSLSYILTHPLF